VPLINYSVTERNVRLLVINKWVQLALVMGWDEFGRFVEST